METYQPEHNQPKDIARNVRINRPVVYCSVNGFGMGVFTIKREQFIGVDFGGVNYDGTAQEQEDGSIVLDVKLNVPSELEKLGYS